MERIFGRRRLNLVPHAYRSIVYILQALFPPLIGVMSTLRSLVLPAYRSLNLCSRPCSPRLSEFFQIFQPCSPRLSELTDQRVSLVLPAYRSYIIACRPCSPRLSETDCRAMPCSPRLSEPHLARKPCSPRLSEIPIILSALFSPLIGVVSIRLLPCSPRLSEH